MDTTEKVLGWALELGKMKRYATREYDDEGVAAFMKPFVADANRIAENERLRQKVDAWALGGDYTCDQEVLGQSFASMLLQEAIKGETK